MSRGEGVNTRDQDEATDRLMRRVLARAGAAPGEVCPAADIVAAYAERRLTQQEAAVFESHAATCGRCQEILALLCELPASLPELVPAPSSALWRHWRWVLPAAAAAVLALAVYIAIRPEPPADLHVAGGVGLAGQAPAAVSPEIALPAGRVSGTDEDRRTLSPQAAPAAAPAPVASESAPAPEVAASAAPGAAVGLEPASPVRPPEGTAAGPGVAASRAARAEGQRTGPAEVAAEAPLAAAASSPAPPAAAAPALRAGTERFAPAPPAAEDVSPAPAAGRAAAAPPPAPIPAEAATAGSPGARQRPGMAVVRWRVGQRGTIERSLDAGLTWQAQSAGVEADLLAVAGVSDRIAWAVGQAGAVLRTVDGERWQRLVFPAPVDLVAVSAASGSSAIVTARDGRRYATSDGGRSWRLAP